jgi:hypothetical protein
MLIMCPRHAPNKRLPAQEQCIRGALATYRGATSEPHRPSRPLADSSRKSKGPMPGVVAAAAFATQAATAGFVRTDPGRMARRSGMGMLPASRRRLPTTARNAGIVHGHFDCSPDRERLDVVAPRISQPRTPPPVRRRCRSPNTGRDFRGGQNSMSSSSISSGSCLAALIHSRSSGIAMIALQ